MAFPKKGEKPTGQWIFRPFYLLIIWSLLALLLVVNGTYEVKRTQDNLYRLLFDEGSALIEGMEKSAQGIFTSLTAVEAFPEANAFLDTSPVNLMALEESVVDLMLEVAFQIDRELGSPSPQESELRRVGEAAHLAGLEVITSREHLIYQRHPGNPPTGTGRPFYQALLEGQASYAIRRSEKKGTGQMDRLSIAVLRKAGKGILVLQADEADVHFFRRRVILQGLIEEWRRKGETKYITFQGPDSTVWADTNPQKIGKKEESNIGQPLFHQGAMNPQAQSRRGQGIFEVAKVVALDRNS
jgi:hypothetical protein